MYIEYGGRLPTLRLLHNKLWLQISGGCSCCLRKPNCSDVCIFYEDTKYTKTKSSLSLQCGTEMRARAFFLSLGKTDYFGPFLNFVDFTTQDCHGDIFALKNIQYSSHSFRRMFHTDGKML